MAIKENSEIKLNNAVKAIIDAGYEVDNIYHNPYGDKIEIFQNLIYMGMGEKNETKGIECLYPYLHPQAP